METALRPNEQDILSPAGFPEMPPFPGEDTLITVVQIKGPIQLSFPKPLCLLMTYPTALISNRVFLQSFVVKYD